MISDEQIREVLSRRDNGIARRKDVVRALDADEAEVAQRLDEMESRGEVVRLRGRYYALPDPSLYVTGQVELKQRPPGTRRAGDLFAFVLPTDGSEGDVYVGGRDLQDAMHGDLVTVELLPTRGRRGFGRRGRIIRILKRAYQHVVGLFLPGRRGGRVEADTRNTDLTVVVEPDGTMDAEEGEKVVVRIDHYPEDGEPARGRIVERLGAAGSWRAELAGIITRYALRTDFPDDALAEAETLPEAITEDDLRERMDLREQPSVTIDPVDAKDRDDGVYVEARRDEAGALIGWRLWVHIADVSAYVPEGSAIDNEARLRSTSAYLPGRHLPMLPPRLTGRIASLHEDVGRLAKTAIIDYSEDGEVVDTRIARTVIRSVASLSYSGLYAAFEETGDPEAPVPMTPVMHMLADARKLARTLRERRLREGSLDLDMPEVKLVLDAQDEVVGVEKRESNWTHQLVEDFMLAANRAVANLLVERASPALYRVHEEPDEDAIDEFAEFAQGLGFQIRPPFSRQKLQKVIEAARATPHFAAIQFALLRSLKQARYSAVCRDHFALAFARYCHFTSPIRRYPDLVVHRALDGLFRPGESTIEAGREGPKARRRRKEDQGGPPELARLAEHCSFAERNADKAEQEAVEFRQMQYLETLDQREFTGVISGVKRFGFFVELSGYYVSGLVRVESLLDDHYHFDETKRCLLGVRTKKRYRLGDTVDVRVRRIDLLERRLDLEPADNPSVVYTSEGAVGAEELGRLPKGKGRLRQKRRKKTKTKRRRRR